jgi:hypothetical protein
LYDKNVSRFSKGFFFSLIIGILFTTEIYAWPVINGVAICTVANNQQSPTIASDGSGGAIITWYDERNGSTDNIYAQRINSAGSTLWALNGVVICTAANNQTFPTIVSDGSSGAIITWIDYRTDTTIAHIYAQRVDSSGDTLWTTNGVAICAAPNNQYYPTIASDSSGGAIITWYDERNGSTFNIYAQRINSTGSTLWKLNGTTICTAANSQYIPNIVSDGSGGALIAWSDERNGSTDNIYAQRVNSIGSTLWPTNGVAICTAAGSQGYPSIISNGSGDAIFTWEDSRNGPYNIYAQSVNSTGSTLWTLNGVSLAPSAYNQFIPMIVGNGSGGAIITWYGEGDGSTYNIYAQGVDSTGNTLWTADGVAVCTAANGQGLPQIVSDGSDGAIITWEDKRNGLSNYDIYAQRVNSMGSTLWTTNGIAICTASNDQLLPTMVSNGTGGAIITWEDLRSGTNYDVYAQQMNGEGLVPVEDWFNYAGDMTLPKRK